MRLTRYTDYALRTLMFLALKGDELSTIQEVAGRYRISQNHLMKVVHELGVAGLVETVRGKGGGMRLARSPELIRLGDVVRTTEPDLDLVECFGSEGSCPLIPHSVLKTAVRRSLEAFLDQMNEYALADLGAPGRQLAALLMLEPRPAGGFSRAGSARRSRH
ncbi:MAG: Rrf2 family transcriptional regulator [Alphaproteobacteria bacterium]|nr:Rrf2 family transcriptional regulator [Alphaproteobacteria bacterium]